VSGSAYAIRASGNQTIISKVIKRQTSVLTTSSGTSVAGSSGAPVAPVHGKANVKAADNPNRVFNTASETVVSAQVADDTGASTWIGITPRQETDLYVGFSRSMHYDYNTLFWGVGFRFGK
jgi:hypothetical protein